MLKIMKFFDIAFYIFFLQAFFCKTDTSFWRIFLNEFYVLWETLYITIIQTSILWYTTMPPCHMATVVYFFGIFRNIFDI
jgi:hypothetical protein